MAVAVKLDLIKDVSLEDDRGAVVRLVREAWVSGLTETGIDVLAAALSASGMPAYNSSPDDYPNVVLTKRLPTVKAKGNVAVRLEYEAKATAGIDPIFSGGSSLVPVETAKDWLGNNITLSHTFDGDAEATVRGATAQVTQQSTRLECTYLRQEANPAIIADAYTSRVNLTVWQNANPGFWQCTECTFRPHNLATSPPTYEFHFVFEFNPDGWQPTVFMIDESTGQPPPDLVQGQGIKDVAWFQYLDFNVDFPSAA